MILECDGQELPAPVSLKVDDEILWSSATGRTLDGTMLGDVVAEKKTLSVNWGILQESELMIIKNKLIAGFFPITFHDDGQDITIPTYRGTLSKEQLFQDGKAILTGKHDVQDDQLRHGNIHGLPEALGRFKALHVVSAGLKCILLQLPDGGVIFYNIDHALGSSFSLATAGSPSGKRYRSR